jgi:transcriptional regulator with GAF, ATPase, and Fis domain
MAGQYFSTRQQNCRLTYRPSFCAICRKDVSSVGGEQTRQVDTRIIAGTNRKLEEEVSRGCFRADLYYRLNMINLRVPPLRERPEDILSLAQKLLMESAIPNGRAQLRFGPDGEAALIAHSWPGNLRELPNLVERAPS